MKILHCLHNYFPATGGAEWLMKNVSEQLANKGHDVQVIASNAYSVEDYFLPRKGKKLMSKGDEDINGVSVKRVSFNRIGARFLNLYRAIANRVPVPFGDTMRMISWGPRSHSYKKAISAQKNIDIIAACPLPTLNVWYAWKAARRKKVPFVIIPCFHTEDKWTFHNRFFFEILREADAVICLTDWEKKFLHEEAKVKWEHLYSLGIGIDVDDAASSLDIRQKFNIRQREIVLFLGQHGLHKGILHLIKAMEYVWREREDVSLAIAGNPTAHTLEIEKKIFELEPSLQERIYLCKSISEAEKIAFLQTADIFVSVSLFESFGIVFLEAWREKLSVIGCKKGGSSKLIDEFRDGILVEFGNPPQLGGAILELFENEGVRKKMGDQGYKKVLEKYNWSRIMDKWENLYNEVVQRRRDTL